MKGEREHTVYIIELRHIKMNIREQVVQCRHYGAIVIPQDRACSLDHR